MSKLIIPASAMLGAPLSDDEMKAILGGATTYSCSCKWKNGEGAWRVFDVNHISSEGQCKAACASWCSSKNLPGQEPYCYGYDINYSCTTTTPDTGSGYN